jgi:hypothetical protein
MEDSTKIKHKYFKDKDVFKVITTHIFIKIKSFRNG